MKDIDNYDLLIENCIESESSSNITKLIEANGSGDMANYRALITRVIQRVKTDSDLESFCSVITAKAPSGVIPVYGEKLTGKQSSEASVLDELRIFKFNEAITTTVGSTITNGTATAEVLYVEDIYILVKVLSGTFSSNDTISTKTLVSIFSAVHSMGTILENYSGDYSIADGETLEDSNEVDFQLILKQVDCTTKDIRTGITKEALSDLLKIYGVTYDNSVAKSLSTCIADKTRQRIFTFMRNWAVEKPIITLSDSYGTNAGIEQVYSDIYARVNQSIGSIGTATGISAGLYTVIASSNVVSALNTYLKNAIVNRSGINYLPGNVSLIEDGYSKIDYMVVALRGPNNNSAVIHTPYDFVLQSVTDSVDFSEKIQVKARNSTINNPLFDLEENTKNTMMELTIVDMSNLTHIF